MGNDRLNITALATPEMEHAFKAVADAREWEYDFNRGEFRDDAGNDISRARFESAVSLGDPGKSGIGFSTLQRAVITHSAIRAFSRGEVAEEILDATERGITPDSVLYASRASDPNQLPVNLGDSAQAPGIGSDSHEQPFVSDTIPTNTRAQ